MSPFLYKGIVKVSKSRLKEETIIVKFKASVDIRANLRELGESVKKAVLDFRLLDSLE